MTGTERAGVPNTPYAGMPSEGTRGRKHEPDSAEAEFARQRIESLAADSAERAKALVNDAAVTR